MLPIVITFVIVCEFTLRYHNQSKSIVHIRVQFYESGRIFDDMYASFRRRKWQPTPVLLLGESHGWRGWAGCSLWGCKESDTTKQLTHTCILPSIIQSIFTALKFPSALPSHPSTILCNPLTSLVLLHLHSLAFSRISYCWNHAACSFLKLSSFT